MQVRCVDKKCIRLDRSNKIDFRKSSKRNRKLFCRNILSVMVNGEFEHTKCDAESVSGPTHTYIYNNNIRLI